MSGQMAYAWKVGSRHGIEAQVAGDEISRIRVEKGKFFTPMDVVDSAREQGSPLHPAFEWDDEKAAIKYRVEQAGYLIRSIVVVNEADQTKEPIRAFVSVIGDDDKPRYTTVAHAFSVPDLRENVLAQAQADFRAFERKFSQFLDLSKVAAAFRVAKMQAANAIEARLVG